MDLPLTLNMIDLSSSHFMHVYFIKKFVYYMLFLLLLGLSDTWTTLTYVWADAALWETLDSFHCGCVTSTMCSYYECKVISLSKIYGVIILCSQTLYLGFTNGMAIHVFGTWNGMCLTQPLVDQRVGSYSQATDLAHSSKWYCLAVSTSIMRLMFHSSSHIASYNWRTSNRSWSLGGSFLEKGYANPKV